MYEFLSNTKDENSWSVNSFVREQVASLSTSSGPYSWHSQINASHLILKRYLAETAESDSALCVQLLSPLLSLRRNEVAGTMFDTLCWRSLIAQVQKHLASPLMGTQCSLTCKEKEH